MIDCFSILASSDGGGIFIIFVIGFIGLVLGLIYLSYVQAKKRTAAMAQVAASLEMTFRKSVTNRLSSASLE